MSDDVMSKKIERHFLEMGRQAFLSEFPNPERKGCPGSRVLKLIAGEKTKDGEEDRWIDHCASCSPCYRELDEYRRAFVRQRRLRLLSAAAIVIVVVCVGTWLAVNRHTKTNSGLSVAENTQAQGAIQKEVLDLRGWSAVRSDEEAPDRTGQRLELDRGRLMLSIYLPMGSEPGKYKIEILPRKGTPLLRLNGTARIENGNTVLSARADLSKLRPGEYSLGIRQPPWDWGYYQFTLY